jgi:hypothetical protein
MNVTAKNHKTSDREPRRRARNASGPMAHGPQHRRGHARPAGPAPARHRQERRRPRGVVRVDFGDQDAPALSGWLPVAQLAAGGGWSGVCLPVPGTQVFCAPDMGDSVAHGRHGRGALDAAGARQADPLSGLRAEPRARRGDVHAQGRGEPAPDRERRRRDPRHAEGGRQHSRFGQHHRPEQRPSQPRRAAAGLRPTSPRWRSNRQRQDRAHGSSQHPKRGTQWPMSVTSVRWRPRAVAERRPASRAHAAHRDAAARPAPPLSPTVRTSGIRATAPACPAWSASRRARSASAARSCAR